ncbi:MAG: SH3 domain-containing protein [Ardenticatenaceae bacterium]
MSEGPLDNHTLDLSEEELPSNRPSRRKLFNLTGMGARIAATVVAIGLGVVIISYALAPSTPTPTPTPSDANNNNSEQVAAAATTEPTATIAQVEVIATFTPGATSTPPPPPATATAAPAAPAAPVEEQPAVDPNTPGELVVGGQAKVSGTDGEGVNMRQESSLTAAVIEILLEETPLELIGGPTEAAGYTWWQVRLSDGREGWVVQDFIAP